MADVDKQDVVRMNRDTLYSSGVFDLEAAPVTITLPETGPRFMSMQIVSQDHYTVDVVYAPGGFSFSRETVGTRYVFVVVRTLADPHDPEDMKAAHALQDAIAVAQESSGSFEVPLWDKMSQDKVRGALEVLGSFGGTGAMFGRKEEVDPISYLIGAAVGWGGNPPYAAIYQSVVPVENDGRTIHTLTVKDVPVDGFWSVSVYNAKGYFEKNARGLYSLNNLTATPGADGSFTLQFGGCTKTTQNCLPIFDGWNYTVRLYRARQALLDGSWTFPEARPAK